MIWLLPAFFSEFKINNNTPLAFNIFFISDKQETNLIFL